MKHMLTGILCFVFCSNYASAVTVQYALDHIGGNQFQYNYTVINSDFAHGIEEISIYFELGLYENLAVSSSPLGWDSIVFQPDPLLPDDGIFDSISLAGQPDAIALGESLYGFSVSFDWLGGEAMPGSQLFEVLDPYSYETLASGSTSPVPLPGSLALLCSGVLAVASVAQRKRKEKLFSRFV